MRVVTAIASLALLAACDTAGLNPLASPSRPPLDIAKEVGMVSAEELVGSWTCRELDPYPEQPVVTTSLLLRADGTLATEALLPLAEQMPAAGDIIVAATGKWRVDGDRLVTTDTQTTTRPADGGDGRLSAFMNQLLAQFADRPTDGTAEIFKVDATELVMRGDEPDSPTVACRRGA